MQADVLQKIHAKLPRGAQARVAKKNSVHPTLITQILKGEINSPVALTIIEDLIEEAERFEKDQKRLVDRVANL